MQMAGKVNLTSKPLRPTFYLKNIRKRLAARFLKAVLMTQCKAVEHGQFKLAKACLSSGQLVKRQF
jgi:hypothetical protein